MFWNIFLLILIFVYGVRPSDQGLYYPSDEVKVLTSENFDDVVFNKGKTSTWLIQFYNAWCGHCRRFAPKFKKLAKDVKDWSKVISLGVVDCSNQQNTALCRKYDITAYPTLKFFPINVAQDKIDLDEVRPQEPKDLRITMAEMINQLNDTDRHQSWPKLKPLRSIEEIWEEAKSEHKHVLLIFEEKASPLGVQLIMDFINQKKLLIRRLLKDSVVKYGINKIPSLYMVNKDGTYNQLATGVGVDTDRTIFKEAIEKLLDNKFESKDADKLVLNKDGMEKLKQPDSLETGGAGDGPDDRKSEDPKIKEIEKPQVYLQDLESALHYSFRQEIAICKEIGGEKLKALHNFISVLSKYLPGRDEIKRFLQQVNDWLDTVTNTISGEEWVKGIDNLQDEMAYLPDKVQWRGCKGSEPHYRGYPCSMWTLFHTLTVNAFLSDKVTDNKEVLNAIKGYMQYFFGCAECSKNFLKMAESIDGDINKKKDMVLWLWSAHNKANKRLHGDLSEDPEYPKIQFPSPDACPKCFGPGSKPWSPNYRSQEVLNFLVEMYRGENLVRTFLKDEKQRLAHLNSPQNNLPLDWWEKKQRQQDLKQLRNIRGQKRDLYVAKVLEQYKNDNYKKTQNKSKFAHGHPVRTSWGLSSVDLGQNKSQSENLENL